MAFDQSELRAFLAVVDNGSLGRAAAAIHRTQPTLSRTIQEMESRFGQPLFERHTKGMALTPAGATLAPHARLLLFEMEQTVEALDALRGLRRGTLRVGAVAAIARSIVPTAVARLLEAAPGLRIELLEGPDGRLLDALVGREVDLILAPELAPHKDVSQVAECDFDDVYTVCCAADHPLAERGSATLAEALAERWIMPPPGATPRILFEAIIQAAGHEPPRIAVETGSVGGMLSFIASTRLLGWLPGPLLSQDEAVGGVRRVRVEALEIRRRFYVYRRRQGLLPSPAREFLKALPLLDRPA